MTNPSSPSPADHLSTRINGVVYEAMGGAEYSQAELLAWLALAATEIQRLRSELSQLRNARELVDVVDVAAAVAPAAKHRHTFRPVEGGGEICGECGAVKKANGRPKKAAAVPLTPPGMALQTTTFAPSGAK